MNTRTKRHHIAKTPIDPMRIRSMPSQFAPVDRRLVYDQHICLLNHQQAALYLFLHCVADANGLSYYGDARICQILDLRESALHQARQGLIDRQLLLYSHPIYQLLDLPNSVSACHEQRKPTRTANGKAMPIGEVLQRIIQKESR